MKEVLNFFIGLSLGIVIILGSIFYLYSTFDKSTKVSQDAFIFTK